MNPRLIYLELLKRNRIQDTLSLISELSYSEKKRIIETLMIAYNSSIINKALNNFELNYIRLNRVRVNIIFNTLKGLCEREKK